MSQGEGDGTAQTRWPISSPWIQKAAVELPEERRSELRHGTRAKPTQTHGAETELRSQVYVGLMLAPVCGGQ